MIGSVKAQTVTLTGTGFQPGAVIQWQDLTDGGSGKVTPLFGTSSQLSASMKFTDNTAAWQIRVTNPSKAPSNWFSFEVIGSQDLQYANEDDYPFQNATVDAPDPYQLLFRECTSYIAWRMNQRAGTIDPKYPSFSNFMDQALCTGQQGCYWGVAKHWYDNAMALGIRFDTPPQVGDIAQWVNGCGGACSAGHVAYVESADSAGNIIVSEYNYPEIPGGINHQFNLRPISVDSKQYPQHFIHMPYVKVSTSDLNFGNQIVGSSTSLSVTVTNPDASFVPVTGISVSGQQDFSVTANTCNSGIAPGAYCQITIDFVPAQTGPRSAILTIEDSDGLPLVQKIPLFGTGT